MLRICAAHDWDMEPKPTPRVTAPADDSATSQPGEMASPLKAAAPAEKSERRGKGRAKLSQKVRVRPSEPRGNDFDEVVETTNVCRTGIYFISDRAAYQKDLRLFVTYPYATGHGAINQEYLGRVVRIDTLPDGRRGIAVHLQMKVNLGARETISQKH